MPFSKKVINNRYFCIYSFDFLRFAPSFPPFSLFFINPFQTGVSEEWAGLFLLCFLVVFLVVFSVLFWCFSGRFWLLFLFLFGIVFGLFLFVLTVFCCFGCIFYRFLLVFQYFTIYYCLIYLHFLCIFLFFRRWRTFFLPPLFLSRFCGIYFFGF